MVILTLTLIYTSFHYSNLCMAQEFIEHDTYRNDSPRKDYTEDKHCNEQCDNLESYVLNNEDYLEN